MRSVAVKLEVESSLRSFLNEFVHGRKNVDEQTIPPPVIAELTLPVSPGEPCQAPAPAVCPSLPIRRGRPLREVQQADAVIVQVLSARTQQPDPPLPIGNKVVDVTEEAREVE